MQRAELVYLNSMRPRESSNGNLCLNSLCPIRLSYVFNQARRAEYTKHSTKTRDRGIRHVIVDASQSYEHQGARPDTSSTPKPE